MTASRHYRLVKRDISQFEMIRVNMRKVIIRDGVQEHVHSRKNCILSDVCGMAEVENKLC